MKIVTSSTVFGDSVGMRLSITYSEVDEQGRIIKDNIRLDRVITDQTAKQLANSLMEYAQSLVDSDE